MIKSIIKRDGRTAAYDVEKIAKAIFQAATSVGGRDFETAHALALQVQQRLEEIISQIDGVGECSVMLTFEESERSVYAVEDSVSQEQDRQTNSGSSSSQKKLVLVENGEGGNQPVLEKTVRPQVNGVVVVCQGAKSMTVCQQVTEAVTTVLGIRSTQVCVCPGRS